MTNATKVKGSKGCFAAGTLISTPFGDELIEGLLPGDGVYSFDQNGDVHIDSVVAVHHHDAEPVSRYTFWGGYEVFATPSHWVQNQYGAFVPIGSLTQDDCMVDQMGHLRPLLTVEEWDTVPVYNLTIEKNKTFFADGLRVHNQGTGARHPRVKGSKGDDKGGGGRAAQEAPNTLRSRATVKVLDLISQGEIYGLVDTANPLKSCFFDDTPVMGTDGTLNFGNAYMTQRVGTQAQTYVEGFPSANNPVSVSVQVTNASPAVRTVASDCDAVTVTIGVQSLFRQDRSTGDTSGHHVTIAIDRKLTSDVTWTTIVNQAIQGKTMTPYERDYRIPRAGTLGQSWDVRVRRVSADDADSSVGSVTTFNRYVERKDAKLAYPGKAYIAMAADAESTGGSIPKRSYDIKGRLVKVPNNYNPLTRVYNGTWAGTFASQFQWTDNPAWCIYDMLTNSTFGLGEFISESQIDKFSFYDAAVYNDQLVPYTNTAGQTVYGPRFTFNTPIQTQEDAWKLIQAMASSCNAFVGEAGGLITLIQDAPKTARKLVTKSSVIDGKFSYQSSSLLARHTAVNVTFNDSTDNYLPRTITEQLPAAVTRYGYNPTDLLAFGCTDEAQARRAAKWVLETENTATEILTYQAAWDHIDTVPGDIIKVMDPDYAGYEWGGRVASSTLNNVTLDRLVDHSLAGTYTISLIHEDGHTVESRTVNSWSVVGGVSVVNVANLTEIPLADSVWVIEGPVAARQFRVIAQKEEKPGVFTITALYHDPSKYARIEQGVSIPTPTYSGVGKLVPSAPTSLQVHEESYFDNQSARRRLRVNWTTKASDYIVRHAIRWSVDGKSYTLNDNLTQPEFLLDNVAPGQYTFIVSTYNVANMASPSTTVVYAVVVATAGVPVQTSSLKAPVNIGGSTPNDTTRGTRFWSDDVLIGWSDAPDNINMANGVVDITSAYKIDFLRPDNTTMFTTSVNKPLQSFTFTQALNSQKFSASGVPTGTFKVRVTPIDAFGRYGQTSAAVTISVLSMATPTLLNPPNGVWNTADLTMTWSCFPSGNTAFDSTQLNTMPFFKRFQVVVKNGTNTLLTDYTTSNSYTFTFDKNKSLSGGPYKDITFVVMPMDDYGNTAVTAAVTTSSVVAPPAVSSVALTGPIVGTDAHLFCTAATTADITLSGLQTVDGVALTVGQRVLVKNQTTVSQNGVYLAASGAWTRGTDMDSDLEVKVGTYMFVQSGTVNRNTYWVCSARSATGTFNTASGSTTWVKFFGGTVFNTKDVNTGWVCSYNSQPYSLATLFDHYVVKVDTGKSFNTTTEAYSYAFAQNLVDHNGSPVANFLMTVYAVDKFGQIGASSSQAFQAITPPTPKNLGLPNGTLNFTTRDLSMLWNAEIEPNVPYSTSDLFAKYTIALKQTGSVGTTYTKSSLNEQFTYTYTDNATDFGGNATTGFGVRSLDVVVTAVDVFGQSSGTTSASFTNPSPAAPGLALRAGYNQEFFTLQPPTNEVDIAGFLVYISKVNGFIPGDSSSTLVYDGSDTFGVFAVPEQGVTYYAKAASYDSFGKSGLSFSPAVTFASLQDIKFAEYKFEGITFKPEIAAGTVSWTSGTALKFAGPGETTNAVTTNAIGSGATSTYGGSPLFIYYVWGESTLRTSTNLLTVYSNGANTTTILASWRGGTDLQVGNGKAFTDGGFVLAQTIGASQLVTNAAVITGTAQIANAVITSANIADAQITNAKIVDLTVETIKVKNGAISNTQGMTVSTTVQYGSAQAVPTQTSLNYTDSGWQTLGTQAFQNPAASAGTGLLANCFLHYNATLATGLSNNGGGGKFFYDNSTTNMAGTHSFRIKYEALDVNDGLWYEQFSNSNWPYYQVRGDTVDVFCADRPTRFAGSIKFNAIQNATIGQAGTTTISQGTQYRPGQFFRATLQVRTSSYVNFGSSGPVSYTENVASIPPAGSAIKFKYHMRYNGSSFSSIQTDCDIISTNTRVYNASLIVQQVFK